MLSILLSISNLYWHCLPVFRHESEPMANMKQIAQMADVSLGTVSHVLNGSARVREPLRRRVLEAVEALGYQPSQLARGLRPWTRPT